MKAITFNSPEYRLAVALRERVLRRPLGLVFTPADLARDAADVHLGVFEGGALVACATLAAVGPARLKVRQVAVAPERQGEGLGRRLMNEVERHAGLSATRVLELSARESAVPFYLALGYCPEGGATIEVGLPHQRMVKDISRGPRI